MGFIDILRLYKHTRFSTESRYLYAFCIKEEIDINTILFFNNTLHVMCFDAFSGY